MTEDKISNSSEFIGKTYSGIIEDIKDPKKLGRCRIRVFSVFDDIKVEDLPWAKPSSKSTIFGKGGKSGSISIPKKGSTVKVQFDQGDIYSPEYSEIEELADDVKSELNKEYDGTHILALDGDEELKIWFTKKKGITIQLKDSRVNIAPNSAITIEHKETQSMIELRGGIITVNSDSEINMTSGTQIKASTNQAWLDGKFTRVGHSEVNGPGVLGDRLFMLLKLIAAQVDAKVPSTPGFCTNLVETFKSMVLSSTVTIGK